MNKPVSAQAERLRSLNNLLEVGLALPAEQRPQWLASLAPEHQALVEPLKALLARAEVETDDFLQHPAALTQAGLPGAAATSLAPGDRIGPYGLVRELGSGGMASVWLAERVEGARRAVALKLPHMGWSAGIDRRVARERDILAALEHPRIARLYEAGVTAEGRPWLAMEFVRGLPLDAHCREQRLDVRQRLALFLQVTDAVVYAHSRLVVHRDLKPSNILVTPSGDVRLLDFGVAKLLQDDDAGGQLTRALGCAVTPDYAAPEQVAGQDVTLATDVYALGVVLYEVLTGQRPYSMSGVPMGGLHQALQAAAVPLASASVRGDAALARQLRGDLDTILDKALRKDPAQRYPSVEALAGDLRRHLAGEPVLARPPSRWYRVSRFVQRNRGAVGSVAALVLAVGVGLAGTLTQASRAQAEARAAQAERDAAQRELRFAEGSEAFMRIILSERSTKPFTTADLLARADALVDAQYRQDAELRARLQILLANLFAEQRDYKSARQVLERSRASALLTPSRALHAEVACRLAELDAASGSAQAVEARFEAAMGPLSEASRDDAAALVTCYRGRASVHARKLRPQAALDDARAALRLIGTPRPAQQVTVAALQMTLAAAQSALGQVGPAIETYEQQLRVAESGTSALGTMGSAIANNLGVLLVRVGQWPRASLAYERGLALAGPAGEPRDHALLVNHARLLIDVGRAGDAVAALETAQAQASAAGDVLFKGLATLGLASAYCEQQLWARCDALQFAARSTLQGAVPPERAIWAAPDMLAARVASAAADLPRAQQLLQAAVARFDAAKDSSPSRARALGQLARVEALRGDHAAAQAHVSAALDHAHQISAGMPSSAWVGAALLDRAVVRRGLGQPDDARRDLSEALVHLRSSAGPLAPATLEAEQLERELAR